MTTEGELLLSPGIVISPAEIALLASVGKQQVLVYDIKPISIVSTGDELVPVKSPRSMADPQIERGGYALASALSAMNIDADVSPSSR